MYFKSLLSSNEIGSNSYLLDFDGCRVVLDAGIHPKKDGLEALPALKEVPYNSVDALFLSHSHLDHTGAIPVLMNEQPLAPLYSTAATAALADALLHNSVNVMQSKRLELGITDYPFYTHQELDDLEDRWKAKEYKETFFLKKGVEVSLHDAGHTLGSAGILFETGGKRIFYTGDIQFSDQKMIPGANFPTENIDTLIIETTRGEDETGATYCRKTEEQTLCDTINEALNSGGSALIPVFAMGKTQEVLAMVHQFKEEGKIPQETPVFIGGLSTKMTVIYDEFRTKTPRINSKFDILKDMNLKVNKRRRKRTPIVYQPGAIFALSSGMMSEKTLSNSFAQGFLSNAKNRLIFVGYADPETPAAKIQRANPGETVKISQEFPPVKLNSPIKKLSFSGHSSREQILEYIKKVNPRQVMLVHGDLGASQWFERAIQEALPECKTIIPKPLKNYPL